MNSNTILLSSIVIILFLSSYNCHVIEEVTREAAMAFLTDHNETNGIDKRESGTNCVSCKFGIGKCCAPNICVKKTLLPDQCMEVKTGR